MRALKAWQTRRAIACMSLTCVALQSGLASTSQAEATSGVCFSEQTVAAGIKAANVFGGLQKRYILEAHGSGAAFFDYDGDGRLDLYVANGSTAEALGSGPGNSLFRNVGARLFEEGAG